MNYIEIVRETLKSQLDYENWGPVADRLLDLYTALIFTKGEETTLKDVHDCWSIWTTRTNPGHKSIVPFSLLSDEVATYDATYAQAIQTVAAKMRRARERAGSILREDAMSHHGVASQEEYEKEVIRQFENAITRA